MLHVSTERNNNSYVLLVWVFFSHGEAVLRCTYAELKKNMAADCVWTQEGCPCTTKCTDHTQPLSKVADTCEGSTSVKQLHHSLEILVKKNKRKEIYKRTLVVYHIHCKSSMGITQYCTCLVPVHNNASHRRQMSASSFAQ